MARDAPQDQFQWKESMNVKWTSCATDIGMTNQTGTMRYYALTHRNPIHP